MYVSRILDGETFGYMLLGDTIFSLTLVLSNPLLDEMLRRYGYRFGVQRAMHKVFPVLDSIAVLILITALATLLFLPFNLFVIGIAAGVFGVYRIIFSVINIIENNPKKILRLSLLYSASFTGLSVAIINSTHFVFTRLALMLVLSLLLFRLTLKVPIKLFGISRSFRVYMSRNIALYLYRCFGVISSNITPILILYFVDISTYGKMQYLIRIFSVILLISTGLNQSLEKKLLELHLKDKKSKVKAEILKVMAQLSIVIVLFMLSIAAAHEYIELDIRLLGLNMFFLSSAYVLLNGVENIYRIFKFEMKSLFILKLSWISFISVISSTILLHFSGVSLSRFGLFPLLLANLILFYLSYVKYFTDQK